MAIGKNAIKRVTSNGYSNVKSAAPDMENSEVSVDKTVVSEKKTVKKATPKAIAPKKVTAPKAKATAKPATKAPEKSAAKKSAPKKSMETEPSFSPVKTAEAVTAKSTERSGEGYVNLGGELPIHLL